ncbi:hypothetical protein IG631_03131 [Alternaria alternata]|nr:hypothetical protein IG631_03131 [Alternaria alternata]
MLPDILHSTRADRCICWSCSCCCWSHRRLRQQCRISAASPSEGQQQTQSMCRPRVSWYTGQWRVWQGWVSRCQGLRGQAGSGRASWTSGPGAAGKICSAYKVLHMQASRWTCQERRAGLEI